MLQVRGHPIELFSIQSAETTWLELQDVDQGNEMHARVIEAVITLVVGGFTKSIEVFRDGCISRVVLARYGMHLGGAQAGEKLLRQVKFGRLRQMGDIARMDDQCRLHSHPVHEI